MLKRRLLLGAIALALSLSPAHGEEIVVSNYAVTTNGMPYAVAMAKGLFKQHGADVTGRLREVSCFAERAGQTRGSPVRSG